MDGTSVFLSIASFVILGTNIIYLIFKGKQY